jgi:hypothetical protein
VAKLAVCGRAGTEVIQVTAPDLTDVTGLGIRASDGGSIYRPPNEERYCTLAHLDTEQQILTAATRTVPQLVGHEQARAAAGRTGLSAGQRDAVITMLTATTATTALVAAAGAGKSHTMAGFARRAPGEPLGDRRVQQHPRNRLKAQPAAVISELARRPQQVFRALLPRRATFAITSRANAAARDDTDDGRHRPI